MIKTFAFYDDTGFIPRTETNTLENAQASAGSLSMIEVNPMVSGATHYVKNGEVRPIPQKPAGACIFNPVTETWEMDSSEQWLLIRRQRDRLLQASDWTQLPDVPLATKEAWAVYRQALRDVTLQSDPFRVAWPTSPAPSV